MKMINNYILIDNGYISYYINKKEIQYMKYANDVLYIKLYANDELEQIQLERDMFERLIDNLFQNGIKLKI